MKNIIRKIFIFIIIQIVFVKSNYITKITPEYTVFNSSCHEQTLEIEYAEDIEDLAEITFSNSQSQFSGTNLQINTTTNKSVSITIEDYFGTFNILTKFTDQTKSFTDQNYFLITKHVFAEKIMEIDGYQGDGTTLRYYIDGQLKFGYASFCFWVQIEPTHDNFTLTRYNEYLINDNRNLLTDNQNIDFIDSYDSNKKLVNITIRCEDVEFMFNETLLNSSLHLLFTYGSEYSCIIDFVIFGFGYDPSSYNVLTDNSINIIMNYPSIFYSLYNFEIYDVHLVNKKTKEERIISSPTCTYYKIEFTISFSDHYNGDFYPKFYINNYIAPLISGNILHINNRMNIYQLSINNYTQEYTYNTIEIPENLEDFCFKIILTEKFDNDRLSYITNSSEIIISENKDSDNTTLIINAKNFKQNATLTLIDTVENPEFKIEFNLTSYTIHLSQPGTESNIYSQIKVEGYSGKYSNYTVNKITFKNVNDPSHTLTKDVFEYYKQGYVFELYSTTDELEKFLGYNYIIAHIEYYNISFQTNEKFIIDKHNTLKYIIISNLIVQYEEDETNYIPYVIGNKLLPITFVFNNSVYEERYRSYSVLNIKSVKDNQLIMEFKEKEYFEKSISLFILDQFTNNEMELVLKELSVSNITFDMSTNILFVKYSTALIDFKGAELINKDSKHKVTIKSKDISQYNTSSIQISLAKGYQLGGTYIIRTKFLADIINFDSEKSIILNVNTGEGSSSKKVGIALGICIPIIIILAFIIALDHIPGLKRKICGLFNKNNSNVEAELINSKF